MYTAASAFFEAISAAGVSHCIVNLGSDHPSIIDAIHENHKNGTPNFPRIITCPSEMVAMSMADGYARVTGQPQCVIVHVDVGTLALGVGMHNASVGRCPVLVFAGLSPFTQEGELRGSRTEFIHWLQDVPDQKAIVAQYCRYTGEVKTGANMKQIVNRALQFATSDPAGPVYLCAAREVMEAETQPPSLLAQELWQPIEIGGLPSRAAAAIAEALAGAERPLIVTGYAARNLQVPAALEALADKVKALRISDTAGSEMSFLASHPAWLGVRQGIPERYVGEADVIVVLHCDVPWVPTICKPRPGTRIFHIDIDPLKNGMPLFYIEAKNRYRADALLALEQITAELDEGDAAAMLAARVLEAEDRARQKAHVAQIEAIATAAQPNADGSFSTNHLTSVLRRVCPLDQTIWVVEAVTNTERIYDNLQLSTPGTWINSGGGGLGWSGGAALGVKLAADAQARGGQGKGKFVCHIVGDGTFMFSVPSSVYWISMRYNIPILTIVLNNNGWNAPRISYRHVHPTGQALQASNEELNLSFTPSPDYAGIAKAAGAHEIHALQASESMQLEATLADAVAKVQAGKTAVVDCRVVNQP